jgi:hypothetical protein
MRHRIVTNSRLDVTTDSSADQIPTTQLHAGIAAFEQEIGAPSYRDLLDTFPNMFRASDNPRLSTIIERVFPADRRRVTELAEAALKHRFDLAGYGPMHVGAEIDWSRDYKTGKCWCQKDYRFLKSALDLEDSDPRVPWELSRGGHFLPMAVEYLLTGRDNYPLEFANQVISWVEQNEYQHGVNWICPTQTAFRIINWLMSYKLFGTRWEFREDFARLFAVELYKAGKHVYTNLDFLGRGFNGADYLAQMLSLLFLGELFHALPIGYEWRNFAKVELEIESACQVHDDGFCSESSLAYHGLVAESLLFAQLLAQHTQIEFTSEFSARLSRMLQILEQFTQGDGSIAPLGDADDLRLLRPFGRRSRDFRDIISIGKRILGSTIPDAAACTAEDMLVNNPDSASAGDNLRANDFSSTCLKESGLCQLRSRSLILNFFANPVGSGGRGNRKHNDVLSLTLEHRGRAVFVDPGTYTHVSGDDWHDSFRSTAYHNTVMVDWQEQNRMVKQLPSMLRNDSHPRIKLWKTDAESDLLVAESDGYARLDDPVTHRRSIFLDKGREVVLIMDDLLGDESHHITATFVLDVIEIIQDGPGCLRLATAQGGEGLLFALLDPTMSISLSTTWIAPSYGAKYPGMKLSLQSYVRFPFTALFAVIPTRDRSTDELLEIVADARTRISW